MPIFVWIAIAIAVALIGGSGAAYIAMSKPVEFLNGPIGYVIAIGVVVTVAIFTWNKTRKTKDHDADQE